MDVGPVICVLASSPGDARRCLRSTLLGQVFSGQAAYQNYLGIFYTPPCLDPTPITSDLLGTDPGISSFQSPPGDSNGSPGYEPLT